MRQKVIYLAAIIIPFIVGITMVLVSKDQLNFTSLESHPFEKMSCPESRCFYDFRTLAGAKIEVYHDFTSAENTRYLFESNARGRLIERGEKLNEQGQRVGERGVLLSESYNTEPMVVRIFWTDGADFWYVQAITLSLARQYEKNVQRCSTVLSDQSLERTTQQEAFYSCLRRSG